MTREQGYISDYYEVMHDPFQACMRRYWNVCGWFNAFLPLWWNGFFTIPLAARLLTRFLQEHDPATEAARRLFAHVAQALGSEPTPADFVRVPDLDWMINLRFDCLKEEVPQHLARMFWKRTRMRLALLRMEKYRHVSEQLPALARDMASFFILRYLFPWIGRQAFAALKPPLPRCAAVSVHT